MTTNDLQEFSRAYRPVYQVIFPIFCSIAILSNCLNILVLTRKGMISPTNVLLLWLAAADGLSMVSVLSFNAILNYLDENLEGPLNFIWVFLVSQHAAIFTHSVAIWIAVVLGFFRALVVHFPFHAKRVCTMIKVNIAAVLVTLLMAVAATPSVYVHVIRDVSSTDSGNTTRIWYYIDVRNSRWWNASSILNAVACRLLPCLLLLVLNVLLLRGMFVARRHRAQLSASRTRCMIATVGADTPRVVSAGSSSQRRSSDGSSTGMLLAVVALSVLTETPQGILLLWGASDPFVNLEVYTSLADFLDTLILLNSGLNFILYCAMSNKFRKTFVGLFRKSFDFVHCLSRIRNEG